MSYQPGETIELYAVGAPNALLGTISVEIHNAATDTVLVAATTAGIVEQDLGGGISNYVATVTLPADTPPAEYRAYWSTDGGATLQPDSDTFIVLPVPSAALPGGVTLEDFKAIVDITRTAKDELLEGYLLGAVGFAGIWTRRQLLCLQTAAQAPVQITLALNGRQWVRVPDAREIIEVLVDDAASGWTGYALPETEPGPAVILEIPSAGDVLKLTARFGYEVLPPALIDAIYAHAARNYRERQAGFGDSVEIGAGDGGSGFINYFRQLPSRVQAGYQRYRVATDTARMR